jgi:hypothetical protein
LLTLVAVLLAGVVLGVGADRVYLGISQGASDSRLVGDWTGKDGDISFYQDGTYEMAPVFTATANGAVTKSKQKLDSGQYRWTDGETIELYVPFLEQWVRQKLVFEGDQLTLLGKDGAVVRYIRKSS